MTLAGHPFDTAKVRLQTQSSTNPIYCELTPLPQKVFLHLSMPCLPACSLLPGMNAGYKASS